MKKFAVSLLMFILVFSSLNGTIFAKENTQKEKVIFQKTEIKDVNKLFERAQKNISDIDESEKSLKLEAALTKTGENESKNIDLKSTTQLLKVAEKEDGTTVKTYAMTVFTDDMSNEIGITATNSKSASQWDSSYSVRAYSTYYYTRYEKDGYAYHDITSCSGGWSRSDSTVSMSQRKVIYGASGPSYPSGSYVQQSQTMYPTSNSFSYTAPSSWVAVKTTHSVGVSTWVTLNRGGSTWTLKLVNQN